MRKSLILVSISAMFIFSSCASNSDSVPMNQVPSVRLESTQADAYNESSDDNMTPPKKRPRLHREHPSPFIFTKQAQWVAVFYDQQFYIGQVLAVHSDTSATIQYLEKTKGRSDYFRWPTVDDVAKTDSRFVFRWDFDVKPVSSNFRMWKVDCIDDISDGYQRIQIAA